MNTEEKLDLLAGYQREVNGLDESKQQRINILKESKRQAINSIITPEMQMELDAIEEEFSKKEYELSNEFLGKASVLNGNITELEAQIKQEALARKVTVKGKFLMAVWNKARETVDMKQLKGYAVAHPEVNSMIKAGEPSVTIRKNGKGE